MKNKSFILGLVLTVLVAGVIYFVSAQKPDIKVVGPDQVAGNDQEIIYNVDFAQRVALVPLTIDKGENGWNTLHGNYDYTIQSPSNWIVDPEKSIIDDTNKILSSVAIHDASNAHSVAIQVNQNEWLIKDSATKTEQILINGVPRTAYMFPGGYECNMGIEPSDPSFEKDCSFFMIPIQFKEVGFTGPNGDLWYELYASGDAETITDTYKNILSTFVAGY